MYTFMKYLLPGPGPTHNGISYLGQGIQRDMFTTLKPVNSLGFWGYFMVI